MKRTIIISIFLCNVANLFAQENLIALNPVKESTSVVSGDNKISGSEKQYIFKVYGETNTPFGEVEPHFLGDEIASKWAIVNELYLRKGKISIGFGSSYTETVKPSVFNAVCRMNIYYKKALNRDLIRMEDAQEQFSWILDCAIAIFYCAESENFEIALTKTKTPEQIRNLFNAVKIEKL